MEENVKIMLLGQEVTIAKDSIMNLSPLITQQALQQIRLPYCISKFKPQMDVLHSCLYYLITVDKNLKESCCSEFRERCLLSIQQYYIRHEMNFQLYEYGYLSGKLLSIPIEKTMHIIYFLVYTRLASKPYINSMIAQIEKKGVQVRKKTTPKSQKQPSLYTKSHESRHLTIFLETNQIETDNLKKQLRNIICASNKQSKKMTKKVQNKRYFNLKKIYPDDNDMRDDAQIQQDRIVRSSATSRAITIPVKVRKNDNSSIISRLKLRSGNNYSQQAFKKIEVRRQKFTDWLDETQKLEHLINDCEVKENRRGQWGTSKRIIEKDLKSTQSSNKNQKHPYQYYQEIASSIRNKNDQLDSIRFECIHHNQKTTPNPFKQSFKYNRNCEKGFRLGKHMIKTQSAKIQNSSPINQNGIKTNRQFKEYVVKQEVFNLQGEKDRDYSKLSKTASVSKLSDAGIQDQLANIITRKNENTPDEDEKFMLFNKKIKNKLKVLKYTQEYRHFLKTQIFLQFKETV